MKFKKNLRLTRSLLLGLVIGFSFSVTVSYAEIKNTKPNVIFILADDAGIGDYQPYQNMLSNPDTLQIKTPNIQQLANDGMMFTNAHSSATVCQPSRFSIMTGQYSFRHLAKGQSIDEHYLIQPDQQTIADMMKAAGYRTGVVGKWHLDSRFASKKNPLLVAKSYDDADPLKPIILGANDYGFDYSFFLPKGISGGVFIQNTQIVKRIKQALPYAQVWPNSEPWPQHDRWQFKAFTQKNEPVQFNKSDQVVMGGVVTDQALDFIESSVKQHNKPFFLYLPLTAPHSPHLPNTHINGQVMADATQSVAGNKMSKNRARRQMVYETDVIVGQVLAQLKRLKIEDNTLVIFSSDNGPGAPGAKTHGSNGSGKNKFKGHKGRIYLGGHKMPFIAKWPAKIKANTKSDIMLNQVDLYSTFAELTGQGVPIPVARDSHSFLPVLFSGNRYQAKRKYNISNRDKNAESEDYFRVHISDQHYSMIISNQYKSGKIVVDALYNLSLDLNEKKNLKNSNKAKDKMAKAAMLAEFKSLIQ